MNPTLRCPFLKEKSQLSLEKTNLGEGFLSDGGEEVFKQPLPPLQVTHAPLPQRFDLHRRSKSESYRGEHGHLKTRSRAKLPLRA